MSTLIIGLVVAVTFIAALRYSMTHDLDDCGGYCDSCHKACSHRDGQTLVERYRKDHPKIEV